MQSGAKSLPAANTIFTVAPDPKKLPETKEMILLFYDENDQKDYTANSGTVEYTISTTQKIVKFTNVSFKAEDGTSKLVSLELSLK
jgi:hypothetical protein